MMIFRETPIPPFSSFSADLLDKSGKLHIICFIVLGFLTGGRIDAIVKLFICF